MELKWLKHKETLLDQMIKIFQVNKSASMAQVRTQDPMPYFLTLTFTSPPFQICLPWSQDDCSNSRTYIQ